MEANLWKALNDPATLSELAILALYGEAVSYSSSKNGPNVWPFFKD